MFNININGNLFYMQFSNYFCYLYISTLSDVSCFGFVIFMLHLAIYYINYNNLTLKL